MTYDLVICGGELIDPGSERQGRLDIAVLDGRIAAVAPEIAESARTAIDATGQIVTPGLVDLHTHLYWGATYWGIEADLVCAHTGVTTSVDAGSAGAYNWPAFHRFLITPARSRIFAFLNISSIGLTHATHELANPAYLDVDLAVATVEENRDVIVGIKARVDAHTTGSTGLRGLEAARAAADRVRLPLMVHIGATPPTLAEILPFLQAGDILTHCFRGPRGGQAACILAGDHVREDIWDARRRGVIFDIGHGQGSFDFLTAEAAIANDLLPDTISSDLHQFSINGPVFDLPTTLAKFASLGLSVAQVIERATSAPARVIGKEGVVGRAAVGDVADLALFQVEDVPTLLQDSANHERRGRLRLRNTHTLIGGAPLLPVERAHRRLVWVG